MELYIIAGPNGVGKTTFAREFLPKYADCKNFINADLIAEVCGPKPHKTGCHKLPKIRGESLVEETWRREDLLALRHSKAVRRIARPRTSSLRPSYCCPFGLCQRWLISSGGFLISVVQFGRRSRLSANRD